MKYSLAVLIALWLLSPLLATASQDDVIFFDDFEMEEALSQWEIHSEGRIRVAEDPADPANHGLLMDDSVSNATFSQNVATITVPISGYSNVRVTVDVTSLNDEVHTQEGFDGMVLRVGELAVWQGINWDTAQILALELTPEMEAVAAEGNGLLTIELHQYDNFSSPDDGLFFDDLIVAGIPSRSIYVESPRRVPESDPLTLTVLIDPPPAEDVVVNLEVKLGGVPGIAIYPAGATMADVSFPPFQNDRLDGDRSYLMRITDGYFASSPFYVTIEDRTLANLQLEVPDNLPEGAMATGSVSVSVDRVSRIAIDLESSDPAILSVPATVELSRYEMMAQFPLVLSADPRVLGDREVTITARIGGDVVEKTVLVTEQNTLAPVIHGPTRLPEGATGTTFHLALDGVPEAEVTVSLAATTGALTINPAILTLTPEETDGFFTVTLPDDLTTEGDRAFVITATSSTGQSGTLEGLILDNDIAGFVFALPVMIEADKAHLVTIQAANQNGSTVTAFEGIADVLLKDSETGAESLLVEAVQFISGEATIPLNLSYSSRNDVLVIRSREGIETQSDGLPIFARLPFAATDIVYDADREQLYMVSGGAAAPGHLHSVTPISPDTGAIGDPLFLGNDPQNLVITDDNQFLYVGLWDSYSVRRIDLETFTAGANIVLNADSAWSEDSFMPLDLLPVPGRPRDVIVSQDHVSSSYSTTRLYIDGQFQPSNSRDAIQLVPAGAPDEFYAFNSQSTGFDFMRLRLTSDGYEIIENNSSLFGGFSTRIAGASDLIFSDRGRVVDGLKMEVVADLRFPADWSTSYSAPSKAMLADVEQSRIYYAQGNSIAAYDTGVFQLVSEISIPGIGNITRMSRWGDSGLALLTSNAEVILFENSPLVPSGATTDLAVTLAAAPDPVFLSEELTYTASIENASQEVAQDVLLIFDLNEGQSLDSVASGEFVRTIEERRAIIEIGDMAPGERYEFTATAFPSALTTLVGSAAAVTRSPDLDYGDNKATAVVNVGFNSAPNSLNVVTIPANDVLVEPVSGDIVVSVSVSAHSAIANHIIAMDPESGLITQSIALPAEPGKLALADDGTIAYALNPTRSAALKVNLMTGEYLGTVPFNDGSRDVVASDMEVLPGTTDSIIIGSGWNGVRVYDNATVRPTNSGTYAGNLIALLPDPTLVFAYNTEHTGFESFKFELDGNGVNTIVETGGLFSGFSMSIKSDGYFVYGIRGKGVRADLMAIDGTFPIGEAFGGSNYSATAVEPDRAGQRVYYSRGKEIASFDSESYLHVRTQSWAALTSSIASLQRWGTDGFVARLENNGLAIFRTDLVSESASPIDLLVSVPDDLEVTLPNLTFTGHAYSGQGIASVHVDDTPVIASEGFANWSFTVEDLQPGENVLTITATAFGNPAPTRRITRTIHYSPEGASDGGMLPDSWVVENFTSLDSPLADPDVDCDGDGQSNLGEFLFGSDPLKPDSPHFTIHRSEEEGAAYILLELAHRDTDLFDFTLESSSNVTDWSPFADAIENVKTSASIEGKPGYVSTTYRIQATDHSNGTFYRIRATAQ